MAANRETVATMVASALTRIESIGKTGLEAELATGGVLLIDVRDVRERWRNGTIPGAVSVPRGMLEFWADSTSKYHKPFMRPEGRTIVFCAHADRSALAVDVLKRLGYTNVAQLELGFEGWREAGGGVESVPVPRVYRDGLPST